MRGETGTASEVDRERALLVSHLHEEIARRAGEHASEHFEPPRRNVAVTEQVFAATETVSWIILTHVSCR